MFNIGVVFVNFYALLSKYLKALHDWLDDWEKEMNECLMIRMTDTKVTV